MIQINQSCLRAFHKRNRSLSTRKRHTKKEKKNMDYKTSTKRIMISIVVFIFSFFSTVLDLARISQKEKEDLKKASYIKADRFLFTLTCITVRYLFFFTTSSTPPSLGVTALSTKLIFSVAVNTTSLTWLVRPLER